MFLAKVGNGHPGLIIVFSLPQESRKDHNQHLRTTCSHCLNGKIIVCSSLRETPTHACTRRARIASVLLPGALVSEARVPRQWLQPPHRFRSRPQPKPSPRANRPPPHRSRSLQSLKLLQRGLWLSLGLLRGQMPTKEADRGWGGGDFRCATYSKHRLPVRNLPFWGIKIEFPDTVSSSQLGFPPFKGKYRHRTWAC